MNSRRWRLAFPTTLLLLMAGCGERPAVPADPPPEAPVAELPSADGAEALIAGSPVFSDYQFTLAAYSLPLQREMMNEPARQAAAELRDARWINLDGSGNVILSEKAQRDQRWLVRPNGFVDIVPIARKEIIEVTDVRSVAADKAFADFTWRWIPNEIGEAFRSGRVRQRFDSPHQATAELRHGSDGWRVFFIERVE
jgi:hypothetical protein